MAPMFVGGHRCAPALALGRLDRTADLEETYDMRAISQSHRIIIALCALSLGAARVGSAQSASDRCSLLTPAAISAALGVNVEAGQPIFTTGCSWQSLKPHIIVSVSVGDDAKYKIWTGNVLGVTKSSVSGLGDEAATGTLGNLTSLWVRHGKNAFQLRVYGVPDPAKQLAVEKTLARDVLKKL